MRRRRHALTAVCVVLGCLLAGCATGRDARSGLSFYNDKGGWTPTFKAISSQSKKDTSVGFTSVSYADNQQYLSFVQSSFRTKEKPDIFTWWTGQQLEQLVTNNDVAPTTALWNSAIKKGWLTPAIRKFYTINGQQYCVPLNLSYWVIYYNKKVFAKQGIAVPKTWPDMLAAAHKLKAAGITPFSESANVFSFVWFQTLLAGTDPALYQRLSTGDASYTDPGVVKIMKIWQQMIKDGLMSDPTTPDPSQDFKDGKLAMLPGGTWNMGTLIDQYGLKEGKDFGTFTVPNMNTALPKTSLIVESGPLCLPRGGKHDAQAQKVLTWWLSPPAQKIWTSQRKDLSANPKVKVGDTLLDPLNAAVDKGRFNLLNRYYEATPPEVTLVATDAFSAFMVDPSDPMKPLKQIQDTASKYWEGERSGS